MLNDGDYIIVSGGDWEHSATDGTWRLHISSNTWKQVIPPPVYPTLPAPHALQDGAGLQRISERVALMFPGSYFPYETKGEGILAWARGSWYLDLDKMEYTHEPRLFGDLNSSSGCLFGGVVDGNTIVALSDADAGYGIKVWDLTTFKLTWTPIVVPRPPKTAAYFSKGRYAKVGRVLYALGRVTDNDNILEPLFIGVNLDTHAVTVLAPPKKPKRGMVPPIEVRIASARGANARPKIVWPVIYGPEGDIECIQVYDIVSNTWAIDDQVPAEGNYIANSICEMDDGRVALCGGVFEKQQTHFRLYEAA